MSLKEDTQNKIKELQKALELTDVFPDIKVYKNRWNTEHYSSKSVNAKVTNIEFKHSCGCCSDAPLYAKCYLLYNGIKVYTEPVEICIGQGNAYGNGEIVDYNWKSTFEKYNINKSVNSIVEKFIEENLPENDEDEDEE